MLCGKDGSIGMSACHKLRADQRYVTYIIARSYRYAEG